MSIFPILPGTSSSGTNLDNIQISDVSGLQSALDSKIAQAQYNVASGVAPLDSNSKIPIINLPDSITSGLQWKSTWNATTNTPAIPTVGSGNNGWFYKVSVAGTQDLGNGSIAYSVGDWVISNGTEWQRVPSTESVLSVAGKTGTITLTLDDVVGLTTALAGKSAVGHTHPELDITSLTTDLAAKASVTHSHVIGDVDTLGTALAGKAAVGHTHIIADTTGLQSAIDAKANASLIGVASGIAPLDSSGKVPLSVIPSSLIGGLVWKGTWDASTNTPAIPTVSTTNNGWFYKVSVAGTSSITGTSTTFNIGDWLISNGTSWQRVENTSASMTGATSSTAGTGGIVPIPAAGMQDAHLAGDGQWDPVLRRSIVTLTDFTAGATLTASTTIDIAEVIAIPQTTSGITVALPSPTNNLRVRKIIFINTGSVEFSLNTGHVVYPGKWVELYWALALQRWETFVSDTKPYVLANIYQAYDRCVIGNITAQVNSNLVANYGFQWGIGANTWSPILTNSFTWRGTYTANTSYAVGDVFVSTSAMTASFYRVTTAYTSSVSGLAVDLAKNGIALGKVVLMPWGLSSVNVDFIGASSTNNGHTGSVPKPLTGYQDASLKGGGDWDRTGRKAYISLSNYTANTTLTNTSTVDIAECLIIPQTTSGVTLTLPVPSTISVTRELRIVNTGSADFLVGTVTVSAGSFVQFTWPANGSAWSNGAAGSGGGSTSFALNRYTRYMNNNVSKAVTQGAPFTFENIGATVGSDVTYSNGYFGITNTTSTTQYYECCFDGFYFTYSAAGYGIVGMYVGTSSSALGTLNNESQISLNSSYRANVYEDKEGASRCTIAVPAGTTRYVAVVWVSGANISTVWNGRMSIQQIPTTVSVPTGSVVATPLSFYSGQATSTQAPSTTTPILFHSTVLSQGSNITYNAGIFTVEAGLKIELQGHCGSMTSTATANAINYGWMQSTDGGTNWTKVGNIVVIASTGANWQDASSNQGIATFCTTTSMQTKFKLQTHSFSNISLLGNGQGANPSYPAATIKEIPSYNVVAANQLAVVDLAFGSAVATPYPGGTTGTGYSIAAGTSTAVTCAAVVKSATNITGSAGTLQFTIQRAGNYRIKAGSTVTNTTGACWSSTIIGVNGTTTAQSPSSWVGAASAGCASEVETVVPLAVGDVVTCRAYSQYAGYMQGGYLTVEQLPQTAFYSMAETDVPVDPLEYGYYKWTADQSLTVAVQDLLPSSTVAGTIPNNNGVFTLTAGKTYEIDVGLYGVWSGNGVTTVNIVDATTNVVIPGSTSLGLNSASGGSYSTDPSFKFIYTPVANQTIKLRTSESSFNCQIMSGKSWVSIKQLPFGSVSLINSSTTPVNEWTPYTPTITGSTTSPTLPTTNSLKGMYKVVGKSLHLSFSFECSSATGATAGAGVYLIGLPAGYTIDMSKVSVPLLMTVSGGNYAGAECLPLGSGILSDRNINHTAVSVLAGSSTSVCLFSINVNRTLWGNGNFSMNSDGKIVKFTAEVPIN